MEPPSGSGGLTACTVMTRTLGGGVEVRLKVAFFRGFTILTQWFLSSIRSPWVT